MSEAFEKAGRELEAQYRLLDSLPGYLALNTQQQNVVRGSLLVEKWDQLPEVREEATREYINGMFCHSAVEALESGSIVPPDKRVPVGAEFFKTVYEALPGYPEVDALVEKTGFPCILFLASRDPATVDPNEEVTNAVRHTCLALGRDSSGNIIVWEKKNRYEPYRLLPLQTVWDGYKKWNTPDPNAPYWEKLIWGARPFKTEAK